MKIQQPPYLQKGDTIGITCPAGYMAAEKAAQCIATLQQWGYQVMTGKTLGSYSDTYFSGTDNERREELQAMLDDKNIKAILFARGGYGMGRIIDGLRFTKFKRNPKWLIGFSDVTVMHGHLYRQYNIASIHAQMAAAFNDGADTSLAVLSLKKMLAGKHFTIKSFAYPFNRKGQATGKLVGGNLTLLTNMLGTASEIDTRGCILFLEDLDEQLYAIDRLLRQLKRAGKFKNLAGVVLGGFTDMKDTERPFGKNIHELLQDVFAEYAYPVCYDFPVSHTSENMALKVGAIYQLKITKSGATLAEAKI